MLFEHGSDVNERVGVQHGRFEEEEEEEGLESFRHAANGRREERAVGGGWLVCSSTGLMLGFGICKGRRR